MTRTSIPFDSYDLPIPRSCYSVALTASGEVGVEGRADAAGRLQELLVWGELAERAGAGVKHEDGGS